MKKEKLSFCTLFDSNYFARGLAMYESLVRHCPLFHLYIFAFDEKLAIILEKMNLKYVTVVTLRDFEDEELLAIKSTRTRGEYCWTCSSSTILYCIEHYNIPSCTYLDSDLFFFSDPQILIDEMGDDDVLITEHRYTPQYDQTAASGKYCVQFVTFKNTPNGLNVLKWWRNACLEWCYNRVEEGKFGDQKYLDDWPTRFRGIHILQHLGGGVAPWNMQQYLYSRTNNTVMGKEITTGKIFSVVFFHFHGLSCYKKDIYREFCVTSRGYLLSKNARVYIYNEYLSTIKRCYTAISKIDNQLDSLSSKCLNETWYIVFKRIIKSSIIRDCYYAFWLKS